MIDEMIFLMINLRYNILKALKKQGKNDKITTLIFLILFYRLIYRRQMLKKFFSGGMYMKQFIKDFRKLIGTMGKKTKMVFAIALAMGAVLGLYLSINVFVNTDKVPATAADYEHFENQVKAIQQNHNLLFETDGDVTVNNKIITVHFKSEECDLTAKLDFDFKLLSIQKEDNYTNWWIVLFIAIGVFFEGTLGGFSSLLVLICCCLFIKDYIKEKILRKKI
ncbi:MAG: hypothetical protein E7314_04860 [Clostridiales bacterium]|nr:hypothetical protein [Clostridiales bacterium]